MGCLYRKSQELMKKLLELVSNYGEVTKHKVNKLLLYSSYFSHLLPYLRSNFCKFQLPGPTLITPVHSTEYSDINILWPHRTSKESLNSWCLYSHSYFLQYVLNYLTLVSLSFLGKVTAWLNVNLCLCTRTTHHGWWHTHTHTPCKVISFWPHEQVRKLGTQF